MPGGNKHPVNRGQKRKPDVAMYVDLQHPTKRQITRATSPEPSQTTAMNKSSLESPAQNTHTPLPSTSPQSTQQFRTPTEVTHMAGIFTDRTLSQLRLGLLVDYGVLYCTSCNHTENPQLPIGLSIQMVRGHLWDYHGTSWGKTLAELVEIVRTEYKLWPGECNTKDRVPPPVPSEIVAPFPHLPILTRNSFKYGPFICPGCQDEDRNPPVILTSKSTAAEHMTLKHGVSISKFKHIEWDICPEIQTFHSTSVLRRYFRVNSALAPTTHQAPPSKVDALRKYLNKVYIRDAVTPTMAPAEGLTRERPFLHQEQWPKHLEKEDPTDLAVLVEYPMDADDPNLTRVGHTCSALLKNYQTLFQDTSHQILKAWLDSDSKTRYSKGFGPLDSSGSLRSYSRYFTRFICLILRTYLRRQPTSSFQVMASQPKYIAFLTTEQEACAKHLLHTLDAKNSDALVEKAIHDLAVSCFAPAKPAQVTRNKYNNICYVFIMLSSVKPDGSYAPSGDLVTATSALQYMFRIILLKQAMKEADEPDADAERCIAKYMACLRVDDLVHPFSALKSLRRQVGADAAAHRGLAMFHWADLEKTMGVYQGKNLSMAGVQNMANAMYLKTKEILDTEVLKALPYDILRIHELNLNTLRDVMDESSYRYSVWTDVANHALHSIRDSLLSAFMTHPSLHNHFFQNITPDGFPIWDNAAREAWLEKCGEFSKHCLGCVQVYSGLSRRGRELVKMRNHNVQTRPRNLFKYGEYFVYILGYSKTTSQTGKDRLDVHALPPKISQMLLIFNAIVRPVAVQWLKELDRDDQNDSDLADNDSESEFEVSQPEEDTDSDYADTPARRKGKKSTSPNERYKPIYPGNAKRHIIQDELTFSWSGRPFTSDDLSHVLRSFSAIHIGIPLGIKAWRHIQEAIHRDLLGNNFEESEEYEDTFFHLQAGHTAKIAALFYAVNDGDRTLEASESVVKYITASKAMQAWLDREPLPVIPGPSNKIQTQLQSIEVAANQISTRLSTLESKLGVTVDEPPHSNRASQSHSLTNDSTIHNRLDRMEARLISWESKFDQLLELLKQSK